MKRFHLSTLLLLTVLAGAFIGANFWERSGIGRRLIFPATYETAQFTAQGFPFTFREQRYFLVAAYVHGNRSVVPSETPTEYFDGWMLALNIVFGAASLASAAFVAEKLIIPRRKPR